MVASVFGISADSIGHILVTLMAANVGLDPGREG